MKKSAARARGRSPEAEAKKSKAVLVAEPSAGLDGRAKTARKGGGTYTVRIEGRAAHSGLDFSAGVSAVLELSRQLLKIAEWTDLERGVTVNPGVIQGGTRSNVVPESAWAEVDVRFGGRPTDGGLRESFEASSRLTGARA